jgi:Glycosyl transferase family 90
MTGICGIMWNRAFNLIGFFIVMASGLFGINKAVFENLVSQTPPEWMVEQIQNDLRPFTHELSSLALDALFEDQGDHIVLTRVRIRNGEIQCQYSEKSREHCVTPLVLEGLQKLHALVPLPDADFVFSSNDTLVDNRGNWPIFAESKNGAFPCILFPDRWGLKAYIPEKMDVLAGNQRYPWEHKIPVLFFRGSDTCRDQGTNWSKWDSCARIKLVRMSLKRPDLIDARFYYSLHNFRMVEQAKREGMITEAYCPIGEHPRFKYLMDLDGNCASCPRTAAIFHSNSVVFKEISPSKQWWYCLLKPYVHFIPVSGDLSDLLAQIDWARKHDNECKIISENARRLVLDVLSEERIYQYIYQLLLMYSEKQKMYYDL